MCNFTDTKEELSEHYTWICNAICKMVYMITAIFLSYTHKKINPSSLKEQGRRNNLNHLHPILEKQVSQTIWNH